MLYLTQTAKTFFKTKAFHFQQFYALKGEVFRALEGRSTERLQLKQGEFFIKKHAGIGWREVFKNLMQCRLPVMSAKNEFKALQKLASLSILVPEIIAYGNQGCHPAKRQSFILTKALPSHISLEDYCKDWPTSPPTLSFKRKLIKEVAYIAKKMHEHGINHRDFYICHLLLDSEQLKQTTIMLYLIDLHRAQLRKRVPSRWKIKDLAALYFSCKRIGLTQKDEYRFIIEYCGKPLSNIMDKELTFWLKVKKRGDDLFRRENR